MLRACATLFLVASLASGCALSHERTELVHPTPAIDAGVWIADAASAPDVSIVPDAGICTDLWQSWPRCPAANQRAWGARCTQEGVTCGVHCCEPGPPIACIGGVWTAAEPEENCGPDCRPGIPCGDGFCAPDRVCVHTEERLDPVAYCVLPPAPMASCAAAPPGSLATDTPSCLSCRCADVDSQPLVTLSCDCCDF